MRARFGTSLASATPAQLHRNVYFPSDANNHPGQNDDRVCALTDGQESKVITLAAGNYLWESYERERLLTAEGPVEPDDRRHASSDRHHQEMDA